MAAATIPVALAGLVMESRFRILFAKPVVAAAFLRVKELILLAGERLLLAAEGAPSRVLPLESELPVDPLSGRARAPLLGALILTEQQHQLDTVEFRESFVNGLFHTLALLAGICRPGGTWVAGPLRGCDHGDAAKFSFLLATPVIFAAGVFEFPSLARPAAANIHGQVLAGAITVCLAAYLSVRFLTGYFTTRTLTPLVRYSLVAGTGCLLWFGTTD